MSDIKKQRIGKFLFLTDRCINCKGRDALCELVRHLKPYWI